MHFGILCPAVPGHLTPMCSLGRELISRGHKVTLLNLPKVEDIVLNNGVNFWPIGKHSPLTARLDEILKQLARRAGLFAMVKTRSYYALLADLMCREAPPAIKRLGIECLIIDQTNFEGVVISGICRCPFVTICLAVPLNRDRQGDLAPAIFGWDFAGGHRWKRWRNRLGYRWVLDLIARAPLAVGRRYARQFGLPNLKSIEDTFSPLAQICCMPKSFNYHGQCLPPTLHHTGPFLDHRRHKTDFPFDRLDGRPLVFGSLGTLQTGKEEIYRAMAEACASLDVQLVISLGDWHGDGKQLQLPGEPVVADYVPQLEILKRAKLTITHGGVNTVMESLAHGVPLVVIPITNDQPAVAERIRWSGVGIVVKLKRLSADRLRDAVIGVLNATHYRTRAQQMQREIREAGELAAAASLVERVSRLPNQRRPNP